MRVSIFTGNHGNGHGISDLACFLNTVEQHCGKEQYVVLGWADARSGETSVARGE